MISRFDDLWSSAANDGASSPASVYATGSGVCTRDEADLLMDAWYQERADRIECCLVLDQANRLIAGLLADGEVTSGRRKQALRLIRAIHKVKKGSHDGDGFPS